MAARRKNWTFYILHSEHTDTKTLYTVSYPELSLPTYVGLVRYKEDDGKNQQPTSTYLDQI